MSELLGMFVDEAVSGENPTPVGNGVKIVCQTDGSPFRVCIPFSSKIQTKQLCPSSHILPIFLPLPLPTLYISPHNLHISASQHPIIFILMLKMPKPSRTALRHHIIHTLITQTNVQIYSEPSILTSLHTSNSPSYTSPSPDLYYYTDFHYPRFRSICQHTRNTSSVYTFSSYLPTSGN